MKGDGSGVHRLIRQWIHPHSVIKETSKKVRARYIQDIVTMVFNVGPASQTVAQH